MARVKKSRIDGVIGYTQVKILGITCGESKGYGVEMKICPPKGSEHSKVNLNRSNKFDRQFNHQSTASNSTIAQAKSIYPDLIDIRNVAFWEAFLPSKHSNFNYDEYFTKQNSELNYRLSELTKYSKTKNYPKLVEELTKIASKDTTASFVCLALKMQQAKQEKDRTLFNILDHWTSHLFLMGMYHHNYLTLDLENLLNIIQGSWLICGLETSWATTSDELAKSLFIYTQLQNKAEYLYLIKQTQKLAFGLLCIRVDMIKLNLFFDALIKEKFQGNFNLQDLISMLTPFIKH
jgi:hypothetical protein